VIVDRERTNRRHLQFSLGSLFVMATAVAIVARVFAALPTWDRVAVGLLAAGMLLITLPGLARGVWRCYRPPRRELRRPPQLIEELLAGAADSMTALMLAAVVGVVVAVGLGFGAAFVGIPFSENVLGIVFGLSALATYILVLCAS
jgi:hypothetical protein